MSKEVEIKKNYSDHLKAIDYHKEITDFYRVNSEAFKTIWSFVLDVVKSEKYKGTKALEIGSGATVHNIAPVCTFYSSIVQSDYVEDNCNELRRWLEGESTLDWTEQLDVIAALAAEKGIFNLTQGEIRSQISKTVKKVVRCDVLQDDILPLQELTSDDTKPPYDLVLSFLCFQAAAPDFNAYVNILKRVNKLLKLGGALVVSDFENSDESWNAGEKSFHYLKLNSAQIAEALKHSGFKIIETKNISKTDKHYFNFQNFFCYLAEKIQPV